MPTFSSIVGHRRLTTLLAHAIARDTLPPTLLLAGPTGVGKFAVAKAVASTVNCLQPRRDREGLAVDACGACRSCERVERDMHVDVLTLETDERASIKIDVVRDVLERTRFRPFEGQLRAVLIRDADALEHAAQNALLKSLEEPPPATMFMLTTAVAGALLPTVRSRCMRLQFGRLTAAEVTEVLTRDHAMPAAEAQEAAALADGRVGEALALGSTDVAVLRETALQLLKQASASQATQGRIQAAALLSAGGARKDRPREEVSLVLRMMASMLRDIELLNTGGDAGALANAVIASDLASLARPYSGTRAGEAFVAVDRALSAIERNAGTKIVSEWLTLHL